jgi:hypothetical protein
MYSIIERQPVRAAYNILNSWTVVVEIHVFHITTVNDYQSVSSTTSRAKAGFKKSPSG